MTALKVIAPQFQWKVAELREGEVLVDGPSWWKEKALHKESVKIENEWIGVKAWHEFIEGGFKLKSMWVRVLDFPHKFWCLREFEKLVKDFGVILEIDGNTLEMTDLSEAKIRIGVTDVHKIPAYKEVIYQAENGELRWKRVRFILDTPIDSLKGQKKRRRVWVKKTNPDQVTTNGSSSKATIQPSENNDVEDDNEEEQVDYDGYDEEWEEGEYIDEEIKMERAGVDLKVEKGKSMEKAIVVYTGGMLQPQNEIEVEFERGSGVLVEVHSPRLTSQLEKGENSGIEKEGSSGEQVCRHPKI